MLLHLLGNEPCQWKVYILECKNSNLKTFLPWNSMTVFIGKYLSLQHASWNSEVFGHMTRMPGLPCMGTAESATKISNVWHHQVALTQYLLPFAELLRLHAFWSWANTSRGLPMNLLFVVKYNKSVLRTFLIFLMSHSSSRYIFNRYH